MSWHLRPGMSNHLLWIMPLQYRCCKMSCVLKKTDQAEQELQWGWNENRNCWATSLEQRQNFPPSFSLLHPRDTQRRFSRMVTDAPHQKGEIYCGIMLPGHKQWKETQTVEGWPFCRSFVECHFLLPAHSHKPVNLPLPCLAATIQLWFFRTSRSDCQPPPLTLSWTLVSEMSVGREKKKMWVLNVCTHTFFSAIRWQSKRSNCHLWY